MYEELIEILNKVKEKLIDGSDVVWTGYDNAQQMRDELDAYIQILRTGDASPLKELRFLFAPTGSFQEHSIDNGWAYEYLELADKFDKLIEQ